MRTRRAAGGREEQPAFNSLAVKPRVNKDGELSPSVTGPRFSPDRILRAGFSPFAGNQKIDIPRCVFPESRRSIRLRQRIKCFKCVACLPLSLSLFLFSRFLSLDKFLSRGKN